MSDVYYAEFKDYDGWKALLDDSGSKGTYSLEDARQICKDCEYKYPGVQTRIVKAH